MKITKPLPQKVPTAALCAALAISATSVCATAYGTSVYVTHADIYKTITAAPAARLLPENPGLTVARRPALPPRGEELSLLALGERIRETPALTMSRKNALRTEIDGLMARFRRAHARGGGAEVAALRAPYNRLMAKMRSMLEQDPKLAADVTASREPIWEVLASRSQFASLR
jgi:hypothetical protein